MVGGSRVRCRSQGSGFQHSPTRGHLVTVTASPRTSTGFPRLRRTQHSLWPERPQLGHRCPSSACGKPLLHLRRPTTSRRRLRAWWPTISAMSSATAGSSQSQARVANMTAHVAATPPAAAAWATVSSRTARILRLSPCNESNDGTARNDSTQGQQPGPVDQRCDGCCAWVGSRARASHIARSDTAMAAASAR